MRASGGDCLWCGGRLAGGALRLALLLLPALFWSAVFAELAGGRPPERVLEAVWWWLAEACGGQW